VPALAVRWSGWSGEYIVVENEARRGSAWPAPPLGLRRTSWHFQYMARSQSLGGRHYWVQAKGVGWADCAHIPVLVGQPPAFLKVVVKA
jgi:hypothetical protein